MSLQDKAMLASLHISTYSGNRHDKKITKEVEDNHNAHHAGRFVKHLIGQESIKTFTKKTNALRQMFYENTLAWDEHCRLLPSENYFDFMEKFAAQKEDCMKVFRTFIDNFPSLKEEAKANLNGMYKEEDYPNQAELEMKFKIDFNIQPMLCASDFRVQITEHEAEKIREQITSQIDSAQATASKDVWDRVKDVLSNMVQRLSEKDAVFRDSLVVNVEDLITLLPKLNFTEDEQVMRVVQDMSALVVNPEALRNNNSLRADTAMRARQIMNDYNL